jgi:hypothetical protein
MKIVRGGFQLNKENETYSVVDVEQEDTTQPERNLICAVFLRALMDAYGGAKNISPDTRLSAVRWFHEKDGGCAYYCKLLGLNQQAIIEALKDPANVIMSITGTGQGKFSEETLKIRLAREIKNSEASLQVPDEYESLKEDSNNSTPYIIGPYACKTRADP